VVLPEQYLGSHIARSSAGFVTILRLPVSGDTKISDPRISLSIQDNIFWLDISVNDVALMQMVKTFDEAPHQEL
jgi:hypothetical protein